MNPESKFNKFVIGLIPGLLVPFGTLIIIFFHSFENYSVRDFFSFLKTMEIMTKLFSLCVLPNLGVFFIFIWLNYLKSARGVLAATFIVAFIILAIQLLLKCY
jgi:hypothetical protein